MLEEKFDDHRECMTMTSLVAALRRLLRCERGNSVIEYALLVALVAVFCLAAVTLIGTTTSNSLSSTSSSLG